MTFYRWMLKHQIDKRNPVGDLARDMKADDTFPIRGGRRIILTYLEECDACYECMKAFDEAWKLYQKERH